MVNSSGLPQVTWTLRSGSSLAIGMPTVTCTVTDGICAVSCNFKVFVIALGDISITCPANFTVTAAAGASTTVVTYATPVLGNPAGPPQVTCSPASGSRFPIGMTKVTCTGTDGSYTVSCPFKVTGN